MVSIIYLFIYLFNLFISIIAGLQCSVSFLLYSMVTQLQIQVYNPFFHIIMLHHKWLDIAPRATQQDLIALSGCFNFCFNLQIWFRKLNVRRAYFIYPYFSLPHFSFLMFQDSFFYYFLSTQKTSFSHSFMVVLCQQIVLLFLYLKMLWFLLHSWGIFS